MIIKDVVCAVGQSGGFNRDRVAIKAGAVPDGATYLGKPMQPGYRQIVQPGSTVLIQLRLEDGQVAMGDCVDVIAGGVQGRDPLFVAADHVGWMNDELPRLLKGRDISKFKAHADELDLHRRNGQALHTAVRYGLTQALLSAAALANHEPMACTIAREYGATLATKPIPILGSSGTHDHVALDRIILKKVDILPHSSFYVVEKDIGLKGEILLAYAKRVANRIKEIGEPGYRPAIHLDCYGTIGELFNNDLDKIGSYFGEIREAVGGLELMIEAPIIMKTRDEQIDIYRQLCAVVKRQGHGTQAIVDEWCNTLQDVIDFTDAGAGDMLQVKMPDLGGINNAIAATLYARRKGMGISLGGSLNETDLTSRISAHVALASQPSYLFAKPGSGGDLGFMIQMNEMVRTLALVGRG